MSNHRVVSEYTYDVVIPATPPYIPGRNNPVVVVAVPARARVKVVLEASGSSVNSFGVDEVVSRYFNRFIKRLYRRLGMVASVSAEMLECVGCGPAFKYVALTNAVLDAMGGGLSEEVLEAATTLDDEVGLGYGVRALRLSSVKTPPYAWRFGEGVVEAGHPQRIKPKLLKIMPYPHNAECPLPDILTHVAGVLAISFFDSIRSGASTKELAPLVRLSNSLWHAVYGVPAVTECSQGLILITESLPPYIELYIIKDVSRYEGR